MDNHLIKSIIITHKESFLADKKAIRREILDDLNNYFESREIIFISGIRRSGKSTLMSLIAKELIEKQGINRANIFFVNFEDERFINFTSNDFEQLYQTFIELENPTGKKYLFFDEIQNINGWERWINRIYEFEDVKIFITGSNATLISSSISSSMTGRNRQIKTSTFSFREYLLLLGCSPVERDFYFPEKVTEIKRAFGNYIKYGGFPEVLKNKDITLAGQYFKDIIYRDIVSHYNIRNIKEIKELALYLITNSGCLTSYENLKKILQHKNITTIKNYLNILIDVYLIESLSIYDFSIKKQIYNPDKYYVNDLGFYHSVGFKFSENLGKLLENIVVEQLLRKGFQLYYWKSKKGNEVDFLCGNSGNISDAVQVTYSLTNENFERETKGLLVLNEELYKTNNFILTYDEEKTIQTEIGNIKVIPIWKWLLEF